MRIAAQKINEAGVVISKSKVSAVANKYIRIYNKIAEQLFNYGYLYSPSYFDADEFWKTFLDEYPSLIDIFRNSITGNTVLTPDHINYVSHVIMDKDTIKILNLAEQITRASQAISDINTLLDTIKFKKKSDLIQVKSRFTVSNGVYNSGKIPLDSPYVFECFYIGDNKKIVSVDYSFEIYKTLLKHLGVDDSVTIDDTALFLGGNFKVLDECKYLNMLSSGEIKGHGKYADLLIETIEKYYSDYYTSRTTIANCLEYSQQNFLDATVSCIDVVNDFRKTLPADAVPVYLDNSKVYFAVAGVESLESPQPLEFHIGSYLSDFTSQTQTSVSDRLMGLCGEFISESDVLTNSYKSYGFPVVLHTVHGSVGKTYVVEKNYYPIYNVKREVNGKLTPLYPQTNINTVFFQNFQEVLKNLEITEETLIDEVAGCVKKVCKINQTMFNRLVGYLFQALLCVMCDYTLDGHDSPGHVILDGDYSWLTKEIFRDACIETEIIFKELGF